MKCMVSYIQWFHQINNETMRLLRAGATQGNPHRISVKFVTGEDVGFYHCVAGNTLEESVSSAYSEISESPTLASTSNLLIILLNVI